MRVLQEMPKIPAKNILLLFYSLVWLHVEVKQCLY